MNLADKLSQYMIEFNLSLEDITYLRLHTLDTKEYYFEYKRCMIKSQIKNLPIIKEMFKKFRLIDELNVRGVIDFGDLHFHKFHGRDNWHFYDFRES